MCQEITYPKVCTLLLSVYLKISSRLNIFMFEKRKRLNNRRILPRGNQGLPSQQQQTLEQHVPISGLTAPLGNMRASIFSLSMHLYMCCCNFKVCQTYQVIQHAVHIHKLRKFKKQEAMVELVSQVSPRNSVHSFHLDCHSFG